MHLDPLRVKCLFRDLVSWDGEKDTRNTYVRSLVVRQRLDLPQLVHPRNKFILDAGCGEGRIALEFLRHGARSICAIDLSASVLQKARQRIMGQGRVANFVRGDIERLPFSSHVFDSVVCIDVFVHLPDLELATNELARVTRNGGKVVANVTNKNPLWCVTAFGPSNLGRFFKDLFLYYCPDLLTKPVLRLLGRTPFGRHLSEKEFRKLFMNLTLVTIRKYGRDPPIFFLAVAEKPSPT